MEGVPEGLGLLEDLLQHEVGEAAPLRGRQLPGDGLGLLLNGIPQGVVEGDGVGGEHGHVPVVQVGHLPGVFQNGGHVGGDEVLPLAEAEDQRGVLLHGNHRARILPAENSQGKAALQPPHRLAHGLQEIPGFGVIVGNEVGHHLRVRVGLEPAAPGNEPLLQLQIVFNDSIVHHGNGAVVGQMGMGVPV